MPLDLSWILNAPLPPGTKGLPIVPPTFTVADVAVQGWNLLAGDVTMPVATLRAARLRDNAIELQRFLADQGVLLAPHGKTTMSPQLFERQLDAGAWGITVATISQARLCHAVGVRRVLLANELLGEAEIAAFVQMCDTTPDRDHLVLVDSIAGARSLQEGFSKADSAVRAQVLIEFGMPNGRCGVRDVAEALELARALQSLDRIDLRGIEGYEGLIVSDDAKRDAADVASYLSRLVDTFRSCSAQGLFVRGQTLILSAGGSVYYDLVAALADGEVADPIHLIVRSGCYLTQDAGFYRRALDNIAERRVTDNPPDLLPALQVWTRVLSVPEPGRAILSAGKRDVSFDIDLPLPEFLFRPGEMAAPAPLQGWAITQLSDQHAFAMRQDADAPPLQVGDVVALGISHPCTTFDKWPMLLEIDEQYRVVGAVRTFF